MSEPEWWKKAEPEIHSAVEGFAEKVRKKAQKMSAKAVIAGKNPFLFRARVTTDAHLYARMVVNAFLSSSEETMFGNVLERIAIVVCSNAKGGKKSIAPKIDLEFDEHGTRTIVQVKSGPNWGNSSQREKLLEAFKTATRILKQDNPGIHITCVEGICYGPSTTNQLGFHEQVIGNHFWYRISDWDDTAGRVMGIIGEHAANGLSEARQETSERVVQYMTERGVVEPDGSIRWEALFDLVMRKMDE